MLLQQNSPLCKLGLVGHNYEGQFNKSFNYVKTLIPLRKVIKRETSISKKDHSIKGKKPLYIPSKAKKSLHAPRREEKLGHTPRKGNKLHQHATTSHAPR